MVLGRSIRIYLEGGEVSGIRHAELVNWTGQALLCPRNRVPELDGRWESVVSRPGVYFLLGADQLTARDAYIGEAEDVRERLKDHVARKDFWQEVLIFSSKDENLTKSHVKYLEARLIDRARAAGRYTLQNGTKPVAANLPRADQDAMEEFLLQIPLLLGVLGHRVLDPVTSEKVTSGSQSRFHYAIRDAAASGVVTDEGFVVLKGSTANRETTSAMSLGYQALKNELIASSKLIERGSLLEFAEDVLFNSPSAAAAIVYGNRVNGRVAWKDEAGRTLKEIEESANEVES